MEPEHSRTGTVRTFTLREANDLIPYITQMFERITFLNNQIKSLTGDAENLVSIWGKDVLEKDHMDNEFYFSTISKREETFQELIKKVGEIQALGCVVKDIGSGLVDFYYDKDGELVFLCWKYGEGKIKHWHPIDGGFGNRVSL